MYSDEVDENTAGIFTAAQSLLQTVRVTKVVPDGWADVNGLMIEDEILKIGKRRVSKITR